MFDRRLERAMKRGWWVPHALAFQWLKCTHIPGTKFKEQLGYEISQLSVLSVCYVFLSLLYLNNNKNGTHNYVINKYVITGMGNNLIYFRLQHQPWSVDIAVLLKLLILEKKLNNHFFFHYCILMAYKTSTLKLLSNSQSCII